MAEMEIVRQFNSELSTIYATKPPVSKAKVASITKLALKAVKYYKHVIQSLEKFVQKCRPEYKIPALYVIDSIIRQSRHQFGPDKDVFGPRFGRNITTNFQYFFKCLPEEQSKLVKVLNLWQKNKVYGPDVIQPLLNMAQAMQQGGSPTAVQDVKAVPADTTQPVVSKLMHGANDQTYINVLQRQQEDQMKHIKALEERLKQQQIMNMELQKKNEPSMTAPETNVAPLQSGQGQFQLPSEVFAQIQALTGMVNQAQQQHGLLQTQKDQQKSQVTPGYEDRVQDNQYSQQSGQQTFVDDFDYGDDQDDAQRIEEQRRQLQEEQLRLKDVSSFARDLPMDARQHLEEQFRQQQQQQQQFVNRPQTPPGQHQQETEVFPQQELPPNHHQSPAKSPALRSRSRSPRRTRSPERRPAERRHRESGGDRERGDRERGKHWDRERYSERERDGSERERGRQRSRDRERSRSDREQRGRERDREDGVENEEKLKKEEKVDRWLPPVKEGHVSVCSRTIWVGRLNKAIAKESVSEVFTELGEVEMIDLIPPRGCAYVQMAEREAAYRSLSARSIHSLKSNGEVKLAWAPAKGLKDYKQSFDKELGVTYIPVEEIEDAPDLLKTLEEGSWIDPRTISEGIKKKVEEAAAEAAAAKEAAEKEAAAKEAETAKANAQQAMPMTMVPPPFPPPGMSQFPHQAMPGAQYMTPGVLPPGMNMTGMNMAGMPQFAAGFQRPPGDGRMPFFPNQNPFLMPAMQARPMFPGMQAAPMGNIPPVWPNAQAVNPPVEAQPSTTNAMNVAGANGAAEEAAASAQGEEASATDDGAQVDGTTGQELQAVGDEHPTPGQGPQQFQNTGDPRFRGPHNQQFLPQGQAPFRPMGDMQFRGPGEARFRPPGQFQGRGPPFGNRDNQHWDDRRRGPPHFEERNRSPFMERGRPQFDGQRFGPRRRGPFPMDEGPPFNMRGREFEERPPWFRDRRDNFRPGWGGERGMRDGNFRGGPRPRRNDMEDQEFGGGFPNDRGRFGDPAFRGIHGRVPGGPGFRPEPGFNDEPGVHGDPGESRQMDEAGGQPNQGDGMDGCSNAREAKGWAAINDLKARLQQNKATSGGERKTVEQDTVQAMEQDVEPSPAVTIEKPDVSMADESRPREATSIVETETTVNDREVTAVAQTGDDDSEMTNVVQSGPSADDREVTTVQSDTVVNDKQVASVVKSEPTVDDQQLTSVSETEHAANDIAEKLPVGQSESGKSTAVADSTEALPESSLASESGVVVENIQVTNENGRVKITTNKVIMKEPLDMFADVSDLDTSSTTNEDVAPATTTSTTPQTTSEAPAVDSNPISEDKAGAGDTIIAPHTTTVEDA